MAGDLNVRRASMTTITRLHDAIMADGFQLETVVEYEVKLESLDRAYRRFNDAHDGLLRAAADDDALNAHEAVFDQVEERFNAAIAKIKIALKALEVNEEPPQLRNNGNEPPKNIDDGFDRVAITKFYGDEKKWARFRDMYESLIHNKPVDKIRKFEKLQKFVGGAAENVIAGFYFSADNYDSAWNTLKARYDNIPKIVDAHLANFLGMAKVTNETGNSICQIIDTTNETTRSLAALNVPVDTWDVILCHVIIGKLPEAARCAWDLENKEQKLYELKGLLEFMETRARGLGRAEAPCENAPNVQESTSSKAQATKPVISSSKWALTKTTLVNEKDKCPLCGTGHALYKCRKFLEMAPTQRFESIRTSNLCYNCLIPGHATKTCTKLPCPNCSGKKHHYLLCRSSQNNSQSVYSATMASSDVQGNGSSPANIPRSQ